MVLVPVLDIVYPTSGDDGVSSDGGGEFDCMGDEFTVAAVTSGGDVTGSCPSAAITPHPCD